jgi:hypothetical protein
MSDELDRYLKRFIERGIPISLVVSAEDLGYGELFKHEQVANDLEALLRPNENEEPSP